jgi:hypothetical protein
VNRPPTVTLLPFTVTPQGNARLPLEIHDADGLSQVTVSVVDPLPRCGRVLPASCNGEDANALGFVYQHEQGDISDDRVTLSVRDGSAPPILVSAAIAIRVRPDRVSIVSDPPLELVRGRTLRWPLRTAPTAASLVLRAYGSHMPAMPSGVSLAADGSELRFDWDAIPSGTAWIAWTLEATSSDPDIAVGLRSAQQRTLVRVRRPSATGVGN